MVVKSEESAGRQTLRTGLVSPRASGVLICILSCISRLVMKRHTDVICGARQARTTAHLIHLRLRIRTTGEISVATHWRKGGGTGGEVVVGKGMSGWGVMAMIRSAISTR